MEFYSATLIKVTLFHVYFLRFLNCSNGTKSCKVSLKNKHLHTLRGAVAKERFNRIQSIKVFCKKASFKEQFVRTKPIKIKQLFLTPTKNTTTRQSCIC